MKRGQTSTSRRALAAVDASAPAMAQAVPAPVLAPQMVHTPELLEQIRTRAYELYEQRGRIGGFHEQDWLQAEAEILTRRNTLAA